MKYTRYHTDNRTLYNSLFTIIALLVLICCIPHALGLDIEDGFWLTLLFAIAAVVTIVLGIIEGIKAIRKFIKGEEKDIADKEKELKKLEDRQREYKAEHEDLLDEIEDIETKLEEKCTEVGAAWQKMIAAGTTLGERAEVVTSSEVKYGEAVSAHDTHNTYCYNVQNGHPCSISDNLYTAMNDAKRSLQTAKTLHNDAVHANKRATKTYKKLSKELNKLNSKLSNRKADDRDFVENHATLLTQIKELKGDIAKKNAGIVEAEKDLGIYVEAEDTAPDYIDRFNDAHDAGEDMEQWIEDNPASDSVKKFVENYERIQSTY